MILSNENATGGIVSPEDEMNIDERRKYLRTRQKRSCQATFGERGELLDEKEAVTSLHRQSLIRWMNGDLTRKPRPQQRGSIYGPEVDDALRVIAESSDHLCVERLQPNLVWMAKHLAQHGEITPSDRLLGQPGCISIATVGRRLQRIRQDKQRLPRKGPERAHPVTRDRPMRRIPWDEEGPGHFETTWITSSPYPMRPPAGLKTFTKSWRPSHNRPSGDNDRSQPPPQLRWRTSPGALMQAPWPLAWPQEWLSLPKGQAARRPGQAGSTTTSLKKMAKGGDMPVTLSFDLTPSVGLWVA